MPKIRDWTFNYGTTTTATTIVGFTPAYEAGDLLLAILTTDTGTQTWSSSGWTQLFTSTNTCNLGVMWKIAGASETDPTFTYTVAETANVHLLSIQDVNTTTPFNGTGGTGTGYRTATNSLARATMPTFTTTVANSLLIYINTESGIAVPGVLEGNVVFEDAADGSAHSDGFSWGFKATAGLIPSTVFGNKSGTAAGVLATIAISPPATGATVIPAYCADDTSIYVDPMHGITAYNGNTAPAATITTDYGVTVNGATLGNGTAAAAADVGINSFHSMTQITGVTTANVISGGRLALATANKPNAAGKNVILHVKPSTPKILQNTNPVTKQGTAPKGLYFGMASSANNFKLWHVHGAGTAWDSAQHLPVVINSQNTTGLQQSTGTLVDTSISSFGFATSGFVAATVWQYGSLWVLDTTTVSGGNASFPVGVDGINKVCSTGKERMSVLQQGASQILVLQPIQFGNGGADPVYLNLDSTAIEFPKQYDTTSKQVFYCSVDNVAGLTYYAGASDTIKHTNAVVSSQSPFHWRIHASASASATYDFSGLSIIGAGDVQLRPVTTFDSMSFTGCPVITQNASTIANCNIKNSKILSTNLGLISGCAFVSSGTGYAIEITTPGTYTFSGNIFSGYGANGTANAAIYNNSGGPVIINVGGGGGTPTYNNGSGASTVVNNTVNLTLSGLVSGSDIVVLAAGTTTQRADIQSNSGSTYVYSYSVQESIDIGVFKEGYVPFYTRNYSLGATDSSLPIAQVADRNFA